MVKRSGRRPFRAVRVQGSTQSRCPSCTAPNGRRLSRVRPRLKRALAWLDRTCDGAVQLAALADQLGATKGTGHAH